MKERIKRQSEVARAGSQTEEEIVNLLNSVKEIKNYLIIERHPKLSKSIKTKIKKELEIYYPCGDKSFLVDADICIIDKNTLKLLAVISVKKSFRERGAQAAYWALKIKQENKKFKYVLATPDVDKEIFDPSKPEHKNKWRIILSCEFDKVFIYSYPDKFYEDGNLLVGKDYLVEWVLELLKSNKGDS